jgi:hypothetical protein
MCGHAPATSFRMCESGVMILLASSYAPQRARRGYIDSYAAAPGGDSCSRLAFTRDHSRRSPPTPLGGGSLVPLDRHTKKPEDLTEQNCTQMALATL